MRGTCGGICDRGIHKLHYVASPVFSFIIIIRDRDAAMTVRSKALRCLLAEAERPTCRPCVLEAAQHRRLRSSIAYEGHVPLSTFERAFLAFGSAVAALNNPYRHGQALLLTFSLCSPLKKSFLIRHGRRARRNDRRSLPPSSPRPDAARTFGTQDPPRATPDNVDEHRRPPSPLLA
jgi:hypothetical protein